VQQDVFFDDLKVTHTKSSIVQANDYYPFGLTFNSYTRENAVPNRWKFQGQEHVDDLGLNWDSFKWRNHQPDIGRFFNVDPLAEKFYYNSPYAFSENKVIGHIELEGLEGISIKALTNGGSDKLERMWDNFAREVKEFVDEFTDQHPEDIEMVKGVNESQTDPQATDTKWLGGTEPTFNPNAKAKEGIDVQVMTTENGMVDTEGRRSGGYYVKEVENTGDAKRDKPDDGNVKLDTVGTKGNVGANGETFNSYYIIQNGEDTIDNRHYVPDELMPKTVVPDATKKK
jgi:RHS repeat-associated protein